MSWSLSDVTPFMTVAIGFGAFLVAWGTLKHTKTSRAKDEKKATKDSEASQESARARDKLLDKIADTAAKAPIVYAVTNVGCEIVKSKFSDQALHIIAQKSSAVGEMTSAMHATAAGDAVASVDVDTSHIDVSDNAADASALIDIIGHMLS